MLRFCLGLLVLELQYSCYVFRAVLGRVAKLGRDPWRSPSPMPCALQVQLEQAVQGSQVLSISKNRESTTSPDSLFQWLVILTVKQSMRFLSTTMKSRVLPSIP